MSIRINEDKCIACGKCQNVCPGTLISKENNNKAYIKNPERCWGCTSCIKECKTHAIEFFLGADIGGNGSFLTVNQDKNFISWIITKPDNQVKEIVIDKRESNKY